MRACILLLATLTSGCLRPADAPLVRDTLPGGITHVRALRPLGAPDTLPIPLVEIQRIRPPDDSAGGLGEVLDIAVGDSGEVYVVEAGPLRIDRYSSSGEFAGSIGREGGGPGEYRSAAIAWVGGALIVHDFRLARTSVFDGTGRLLRSWTSSCCIGQGIRGDQAGRIYLPVLQNSGPWAGQQEGWLRYRQDGTLIDTVWRRLDTRVARSWRFKTRSGAEADFAIPFQPSLFDLPWPGGGVVTGDNADYRFLVTSDGADTVLMFERAWVVPRIPAEVRQRELARFTDPNPGLRAVARLDEVPTAGLAFDDLATDGAGVLWVRRVRYGEGARTDWDIFSPQGTWCAAVTIPSTYDALTFHGSDPVVATTDERDVPMIIRYRFPPLHC